MSRGPAYERSSDVLVIGAGLAGLLAAAALSQPGWRVAVVARGVGSVASSTGLIDALRRTPAGAEVEDLQATLTGFASRWPDHPYARTGWEALVAAENYLAEILATEGLTYRQAGATANTMIVTALGALKPTHMFPATAATFAALQKKSILVLSFAGLADFGVSLIQAHLARLLPHCRVSRAMVRLPREAYTGDATIKAPTLAGLFDVNEKREKLIKEIKEAIPPRESPEVILMPAVLGLKRSAQVGHSLRNILGVEVLEIPTLPPSIPGVRLFNALKTVLDARGVHLGLNAQALQASVAGGRVESVDVASEGKVIRYQARYYLLASGGLVGGGLIEDQGRVYEPLFSSPLMGPYSLSYRKFPFNVGVAVEAGLRVRGFHNLFACGRILGGYNPYIEGCGNGLALATAWQASLTVKGEDRK